MKLHEEDILSQRDNVLPKNASGSDVSNCFGLNYLTDQPKALLVCIKTICITLLGRLLVSTSPPPGQHKLKHDDRVRALLLWLGTGLSMVMRAGGGMWSDYGAESSAGAAFILVESQESSPCKALSDTG